jgi:hypothetical protein
MIFNRLMAVSTDEEGVDLYLAGEVGAVARIEDRLCRPPAWAAEEEGKRLLLVPVLGSKAEGAGTRFLVCGFGLRGVAASTIPFWQCINPEVNCLSTKPYR